MTSKVKLGEVVSLKKGRKTNFFETSTPGSVRFIQIDDLRTNDNLKYTTDTNRVDITADNVLIAWDGANAGTVGYSLTGAIGSTITALIKQPAYTERVDAEYLGLFLKHHTAFLRQQATGATIPHLNKTVLLDLELPLLSKTKQESIKDKVRQVEQLQAERQEQLQLLDELIKSRFNEMFGEEKHSQSIGSLVEIYRGASPRPIDQFITEAKEGVNWIKIGDVSENSMYISETKEKITIEGANKSRRVKPGDFILSNSMSFGRPYILAIEGCVHDGWLVLTNFNDIFNKFYLYHALRDDYVQVQFNKVVNGATVKNLNSNLVRETMIKVPPLPLQEEFARFVEAIDKSKFVCQKWQERVEKLLKIQYNRGK